MWNIRKIVKKGNYLYAVVPEHPKARKYGYVLAHRVIMENKLGRELQEIEEVHHIDGNRHNNSPENLEIMLRGEHQRHHIKLRFPNGRKKKILLCKNCRNKFEREVRQIHPGKQFCSRECYRQSIMSP